MKKITFKLNIDSIGTIILIAVILTIIIALICSNGHYIAHFSIASSLLALRDNPLIKHAETNIEKKDFLMQEIMNKKFIRAIKKEIINNNAKNFVFKLTNYLFIADKN